MFVEKLLELLPGLENGLNVVPDWPVRQMVKRLVSEEVLVHEEGFGLRPQDGQVEDGHVPLSLDSVQEHADLHAEFYSVLGLIGREREKERVRWGEGVEKQEDGV